jgi:hypothetical protein
MRKASKTGKIVSFLTPLSPGIALIMILPTPELELNFQLIGTVTIPVLHAVY